MGTDIFWILILLIALQPLIKQKVMEFARKRLLMKMEQQRSSRMILLVHRQETMVLLGFPIFRYIFQKSDLWRTQKKIVA